MQAARSRATRRTHFLSPSITFQAGSLSCTFVATNSRQSDGSFRDGRVGRTLSGTGKNGRFVWGAAYTREFMKILILALTLSVAGFATQQPAPIPADEVTLRHRIYGDGRVTIFLLDIPPGQATLPHRHDRDMLSVFVNGGRTRASFNGAAPVEDSFMPGDVRFRSAGFTHSTENIGTDRFLSVIFEFVDRRARASRRLGPPRASAIRIVRPPASMNGRCSAGARSVLTT